MASMDGMEPGFRDSIMQMIADSDGKVYLVSGSRSRSEQQALWDEAVALYGEDEARNWVAPPDHSNHERGIAADLGGDLEWAAANAANYGLYRPMDWEPWHFEPNGSRDGGDSQAYTPAPTTQFKSLGGTATATRTDPMQVLLSMVHGGQSLRSKSKSTSLDKLLSGQQPQSSTRALGTITESRPGAAGSPGPPGNSDIDMFMAAVRAHESGGDYGVYGPPTPWGRASGAYQFLDGTWGGYGGYSRAADAPPELQDAKARELMQSYYDQFGNWADVAASWFAGPAGDFSTGEVQSYVTDVLQRMYNG